MCLSVGVKVSSCYGRLSPYDAYLLNGGCGDVSDCWYKDNTFNDATVICGKVI